MSVLITGGAGFIGVNLAGRLLDNREKVTVFDNLSRPGSEKNLAWLEKAHPGAFTFIRGDIRDRGAVADACRGVQAVFHFAAQVAVTGSVSDPVGDFEINAGGTLNLLEGVRRHAPEAAVVFSSTNKVYGALEALPVREEESRYALKTMPLGVGETVNLDFHSPYGCSKGAADQYVRDYARIYGLNTVVFRQSCIYGPHQFGNEDQGWVAFFLLCALENREITVYGNGKQVRDLLFASDLVDLFLAARDNIARLRGRVYNVGGGPRATLSLLELLVWLERKTGRPVRHGFSDWRPGDQKVYISDISLIAADLGWAPRVAVGDGLEKLFSWLASSTH
jgi:CDP-paratose 2-epimerase